MKRPPLRAVSVALLLLAPAAVARAEGPTPGKEYVLAHKSVYGVAEGERNPFWPIGFKPSAPTPDAPQAPVAEALPEVRPEMFVVTTISMEQSTPLAVINGRTHGIGDRLPVDASGREFVVVRRIVDGAVFFDFHGQTIKSVPGRRGPGK